MTKENTKSVIEEIKEIVETTDNEFQTEISEDSITLKYHLSSLTFKKDFLEKPDEKTIVTDILKIDYSQPKEITEIAKRFEKVVEAISKEIFIFPF